MGFSTDFIDVVEDLLIVVLLVVFLYLLYYNFRRKPVRDSGEFEEGRLLEVSVREEDLKQKRKSIEQEIEDKKKEYLKGKVKRGEYQSFLRAKHAELVSLKSKLNK